MCNKTSTITFSNREKVAVVLDMRTTALQFIKNEDERCDIEAAFVEAYVAYGLRAHETRAAPIPTSGDTSPEATTTDACDEAQQTTHEWQSLFDPGADTSKSGAESGEVPDPTPSYLEVEAQSVLARFRKEAGDHTAFKETFGFQISNLMDPKMVSLDLGKFYQKLHADNADWKYGFIPQMAAASGYSVGSVNSESYCERMMSAAKLVLGKNYLKLDSGKAEKLILLRMNRNFMKRMYAKLPTPETQSQDVERHRIRQLRRTHGEFFDQLDESPEETDTEIDVHVVDSEE